MNRDTLSVILDHLPMVSDICRCRRVCRMWCKVVDQMYRQHTNIRLMESSSVPGVFGIAIQSISLARVCKDQVQNIWFPKLLLCDKIVLDKRRTSGVTLTDAFQFKKYPNIHIAATLIIMGEKLTVINEITNGTNYNDRWKNSYIYECTLCLHDVIVSLLRNIKTS